MFEIFHMFIFYQRHHTAAETAARHARAQYAFLLPGGLCHGVQFFAGYFIIIAQRITSVMEADEIFVMENGKIVGHGSHEQLLESCPEYSEIYYSQTEGKERA